MTDPKDRISRGGYLFVAIWAIGILSLYALGSVLGARILRAYKGETESLRQTWLGSATMDLEKLAPESNVTSAEEPVDVAVGIRVNRISAFSLRESTWRADFDIWFRWSGEKVNPGENFQVVNGEVDHLEKEESYTDGSERYERFSVRADLTINIDASRFPFGDQVMSIQVEDRADGADELRFIPDEEDCGVNSLGIPPSMKITRTLAASKLYSYKSKRGDPRMPEGRTAVHSRFVLAFLMVPPGAGLFLALFQALFASIAIAFVVFFIKPTQVDPRFGLGVGAFFAVVGNNIFVASVLPFSSQISLSGMINGIGLVTIFLTLVQSTVSLYIFDIRGRVRLSRFFDHVSFAAFLAGYAAVNLILIHTAGS